MRRLIRFLAVLVGVYLLLFLCSEGLLQLGIDIGQRYPFYKRWTLAQELGVGAYNEPGFPKEYFASLLDLGTPISEVHEIIRGYERVYDCGKSEVYYFYSRDDIHSMRFSVLYDFTNAENKESFTFKEIRGEDDDSRTILVDGCYLGRIGD